MAADGLKILTNIFRRGETRTTSKDDELKDVALQTINRAVENFLASREVEDFKVYTLEYGGHPVVLIKAKPQKKLRYSNILEAQIRQFVMQKLNVDVPAVFWRFKVDYEAGPGPEQADYDYNESSTTANLADVPTQRMTEQESGTEIEAEEEKPDNLYDARYTLRTGMHVEEVDEGLDFEAFLQGTTQQHPPEGKPGE